ncbi:MAG: MFS transporter [Candidatus Dormibacterales bacterium]
MADVTGGESTLASGTLGWPEPGFWRLNGINAFWAASQGMWNAIYVLLALSAALTAPSQKALVVGKATAAGGVLAVAVPVAAGWLSDRTRSRWGRRTPWIAAGAGINALGLVLLAWASSVPALIAAYLVLQVGNNAAAAAFAGIVPDVVPEPRRGRASGLLNASSIVGTMLCLAASLVVLRALGSTSQGAAVSYLVLAVLLAAGTLTSLAVLAEPSSKGSRPPPREAPAAPARGAWRAATAPLAHHDFRWVLTTRFFQTLGIWTILPFVAFYFQDVVRAPNYAAASDLWLLAVLGGGVLPAVACGYLSDRTGRRKAFVYASSALQGLVACVLLFTLVSDLRAVYLLGILFGIGYGAYSSVDWALACDVLPDRARSGARDMALFHVAYTLPQVFAPALLSPVLYELNRSGTLAGITTGHGLGYRAVFASAAVWFVLATLWVRRIRGVR